MNIAMVIPTYWGRRKGEPWKEGDAVYDHPTALDDTGTLLRTLESIKTLDNKKFKLVIPVCTTCDEIEDEAVEIVRDIVKAADLDMPVYIFTSSFLAEMKAKLKSKGLFDRALSLLSMKGYANVRNICLFTPSVLGADIAILIDDDEIFEKPEWIDMATEFIGKRIYGKSIYGVAGYYLNRYDEYYDDVDIVPWMTYFNRFGSKTKAFDKVISSDPRLKVTPFAFGGAMVIHKNLYNIVPFDPDVTRGEDIDYLINAKMYGYDFFLDNKLSIKHLPPQKDHPIWKRLREDIYRFLYEQAKIRAQYEVNNMDIVEAEEFDPYPGDFLKDDIKDKIYKTSVLLALEYLCNGDVEGCREAIKNVYLAEYEAVPDKDTFTEYRRRQREWVELMSVAHDIKSDLRAIMEEGNQRRIECRIDLSKYKRISKNILVENIKRFQDFKGLTDAEVDLLANYMYMRAYNEDDMVFVAGDTDLELSLIITGSVRVIEHSEDGAEILLATIDAGGVLGETLMVKSRYATTAIANEFVEMVVISRESIEELMVSHPVIGNKILYIFMNEIYKKLLASNKAFKDMVDRSEGVEMD